MSNNVHDKAALEAHFADIFASLTEQDIEQFYAHYQLWVLRRRLPLIEKQLEALHEHLAENQRLTEALRPSALALAVLVRLQSNGVSDTDVLDLMLERGEDWLDRMMQRLDYCEQVEDFIQGDYTQWCIRSLEGAYDWIDTLLGSIKEGTSQRESVPNDNVATEELLLQKLSQDDEEAIPGVIPTQPAAQLEVPGKSHLEISAEAETASGPESGALPGEPRPEPHESREQAPTAAAEVAEQPESGEAETAPELLGWKDLEDLADLAAPQPPPVPWYSVNVTENGASSPSSGTANTMDDWIKVLQTENATSIEAGSTDATGTSALELPTFASEVETAEEITESTSAAEAVKESAEEETGDESIEEEIAEGEAVKESAEEETGEGEAVGVAVEEDVLESEPLAETQSKLENAVLVEPEALQEPLDLSPEEQPLVESSGETALLEETPVGVAESIEYEAGAENVEDNVEQPAGTGEAILAAAVLVSSLPEVETPADEISSAESGKDAQEAAPGRVEPAEDEEEQPAPEPDLPEEGEAETPDSDHVPETGKGESGREIESAAIVNDILSGEEEQEEQLAWYEYLDLEEPVNNAVHSGGSERIEPEENELEEPGDNSVGDSFASGKDTPEIYEYAITDALTKEPTAPLPVERMLVGEAGEIEGWQTWHGPADAEETLPLALKEIHLAGQAQDSNAPGVVETHQTSVQSRIGEAAILDELADAPTMEMSVLEVAKPASIDELADAPTMEMSVLEVAKPVPTKESTEDREDTETGMISATETDSETPALVLSEASPHEQVEDVVLAAPEVHAAKLVQEPGESGETTGAAVAGSVTVLEDQPEVSQMEVLTEQRAESAPIEAIPLAHPVSANEKAPQKLGFWRRLFRFGRKKKG